MPRREAFDADEGDGGIMMAHNDRSSKASSSSNTSHRMQLLQQSKQKQRVNAPDQDLLQLERQLNDQVDEDLFAEPRTFNTLHRVIDVLGLQMLDDNATLDTALADVARNPAYKSLKAQQSLVEDAIEHMAVLHCADLNGSVIQVGRVSKQMTAAVHQVRQLRHQVLSIQETLGVHHHHHQAASSAATSSPQHHHRSAAETTAASMSLRELWLKKLECEATLVLLERLDIIRTAPRKFDYHVARTHIGAATLVIAHALQVMFCDDVAQVQALHKIMEQLLLRKQKAEETLWETLSEVVYLRNANGVLQLHDAVTRKQNNKATTTAAAAAATAGSNTSVTSRDSRSRKKKVDFAGTDLAAAAVATVTGGNHNTTIMTVAGAMENPFLGRKLRFAIDEDLQLEHEIAAGNDEDDASGASLFSLDDVDEDDMGKTTPKASGSAMSVHTYDSGNHHAHRRMLIPIPIVEAELDLELDERRCLEEVALSGLAIGGSGGGGGTAKSGHRSSSRTNIPKYADPVLALRLLVEGLAQLKRVDDVERILHEGLSRELRGLIQREQARTFARLERHGGSVSSSSSYRLTHFRRHLAGLLSAFGCVMLRLTHLAEILRFRISSDRELMQTIGSPSSVMRSVLSSASLIMQKEIKEFLKACLSESESDGANPMVGGMAKRPAGIESGLFSLGIIDNDNKTTEKATATRSNVMEMPATKFVSTVLFAKTKSQPQARHALTFRRIVARWTTEVETLQKELATLTNEDTSAPSYGNPGEESAIAFLDRVIQTDLLPVLQEEAVNGTVGGLERRDAFDPILDRSLYAQPNSNEPQDVDMCIACQTMYDSSGPLFLALHRLPKGGEMYMPLVAVLEHVMLTFTSRVKQQVEKLCQGKTAMAILKAETGDAFGSLMERRKPFAMLLRAYADGDTMDSSFVSDNGGKDGGLTALAPSASDTVPRQGLSDLKNDAPLEDIADDVDGEELLLESEAAHLEQYLDFAGDNVAASIAVCSDEDLMKASCLCHSLMKLASLLESRLKVRGSSSANRTLTSTRTLREAIKTIKASAVEMAKFCRLDMLMQCISRLSKICKSSTLVATDAVRIPSSVNDLGEYLTGASDNLRDAAGNAVTAYTLSSLEQYIPLCLIRSVRVVAIGKGIIARSSLTMNGVEALDRSGSVLYRDLKGATSFDNSFWDVELAAISFERSASFMAMMELEMDELVSYYTANKEDFPERDWELMFAMNGPRRRGDVGRLHMLNRKKR